MGADYIPERDVRAACWMKNFARLLVERPDAYRTTPEDAAEIDALVLAFRLAVIKAGRPITRTPVAVRDKSDARKAAELLVRNAAQRIRTDPRIGSNLKILIGLKPGKKRRHKIPPPESVPVLQATTPMSGEVKFRVNDSVRRGRARPPGAKGLELYHQAEPDGPWVYVGVYTRTPFSIYPKAERAGQSINYVARWISARGEPGMFGQPITAIPYYSAARPGSEIHQRERRVA